MKADYNPLPSQTAIICAINKKLSTVYDFLMSMMSCIISLCESLGKVWKGELLSVQFVYS